MTNTIVTNLSFAGALILLIAAGFLKVLPPEVATPAFTSILGAWLGLQVIPPHLQQQVTFVPPTTVQPPDQSRG